MDNLNSSGYRLAGNSMQIAADVPDNLLGPEQRVATFEARNIRGITVPPLTLPSRAGDPVDDGASNPPHRTPPQQLPSNIRQATNSSGLGPTTPVTAAAEGQVTPGDTMDNAGRRQSYGAWYVPPKEWKTLYDSRRSTSNNPDAATGAARTSAAQLHVPEGIEGLTEEEREEREAMALELGSSYTTRAYKEHLRAHNLRPPGVLERLPTPSEDQIRRHQLDVARAEHSRQEQERQARSAAARASQEPTPSGTPPSGAAPAGAAAGGSGSGAAAAGREAVAHKGSGSLLAGADAPRHPSPAQRPPGQVHPPPSTPPPSSPLHPPPPPQQQQSPQHAHPPQYPDFDGSPYPHLQQPEQLQQEQQQTSESGQPRLLQRVDTISGDQVPLSARSTRDDQRDGSGSTNPGGLGSEPETPTPTVQSRAAAAPRGDGLETLDEVMAPSLRDRIRQMLSAQDALIAHQERMRVYEQERDQTRRLRQEAAAAAAAAAAHHARLRGGSPVAGRGWHSRKPPLPSHAKAAGHAARASGAAAAVPTGASGFGSKVTGAAGGKSPVALSPLTSRSPSPSGRATATSTSPSPSRRNPSPLGCLPAAAASVSAAPPRRRVGPKAAAAPPPIPPGRLSMIAALAGLKSGPQGVKPAAAAAAAAGPGVKSGPGASGGPPVKALSLPVWGSKAAAAASAGGRAAGLRGVQLAAQSPSPKRVQLVMDKNQVKRTGAGGSSEGTGCGEGSSEGRNSGSGSGSDGEGNGSRRGSGSSSGSSSSSEDEVEVGQKASSGKAAAPNTLGGAEARLETKSSVEETLQSQASVASLKAGAKCYVGGSSRPGRSSLRVSVPKPCKIVLPGVPGDLNHLMLLLEKLPSRAQSERMTVPGAERSGAVGEPGRATSPRSRGRISLGQLHLQHVPRSISPVASLAAVSSGGGIAAASSGGGSSSGGGRGWGEAVVQAALYGFPTGAAAAALARNEDRGPLSQRGSLSPTPSAYLGSSEPSGLLLLAAASAGDGGRAVRGSAAVLQAEADGSEAIPLAIQMMMGFLPDDVTATKGVAGWRQRGSKGDGVLLPGPLAPLKRVSRPVPSSAPDPRAQASMYGQALQGQEGNDPLAQGSGGLELQPQEGDSSLSPFEQQDPDKALALLEGDVMVDDEADHPNQGHHHHHHHHRHHHHHQRRHHHHHHHHHHNHNHKHLSEGDASGPDDDLGADGKPQPPAEDAALRALRDRRRLPPESSWANPRISGTGVAHSFAPEQVAALAATRGSVLAAGGPSATSMPLLRVPPPPPALLAPSMSLSPRGAAAAGGVSGLTSLLPEVGLRGPRHSIGEAGDLGHWGVSASCDFGPHCAGGGVCATGAGAGVHASSASPIQDFYALGLVPNPSLLRASMATTGNKANAASRRRHANVVSGGSAALLPLSADAWGPSPSPSALLLPASASAAGAPTGVLHPGMRSERSVFGSPTAALRRGGGFTGGPASAPISPVPSMYVHTAPHIPPTLAQRSAEAAEAEVMMQRSRMGRGHPLDLQHMLGVEVPPLLLQAR